MNRSLVAQFVLRLQDRTSAGLGAIQRRLQGLAQIARRVALVGGVAGGLSMAGPIQQASAFDVAMRNNAVTAGETGAAVEAMMLTRRRAIEDLAVQTRQTSINLVRAEGSLIAAGMSAEIAAAATPILANVSTAAGAAVSDIASTGNSVMQAFRVPVEELRQSFAILVAAGKAGSFELRAMAQFLPSINSRLSALGMAGQSAVSTIGAAMQIVRRGAGTDAEAATNMENLLSKLTSTDALRNFREQGVDMEGVLRGAREQGVNPLLAAIQKIRQITQGDPFRLAELIPDMQAQNAIRPLMDNFGELIEMERTLSRADWSGVLVDFASQNRGIAAESERATEAATQLGRRLGDAFERALTILTGMAAPVRDLVRQFDDAFPGMIDQTLTFAAVLAGGAAAITGLGLVIGPLGTGLKLLLSPVGLVVAAIALLAFGAYKLWQNWEPIAGWFTGLWQDLRTGMQPQVDWLLDVVNTVGAGAVATFRAAWEPLTAFFTDLWAGIRAPFDSFISGVERAIERVRSLLPSLVPAQPAIAGAPPALGLVQQRQAEAAAARAAETARLAAAIGGPGAAPRMDGRVTVEVRPAPGAEVVSTESDNRQVPVTTVQPNRGGTRALP